MTTLARYIQDHGITVEMVSGPDCTRDEDGWDHYAYELVLHNFSKGTKMKVPWRQGVGITEDPDTHPENVLGVLVNDGWSYEQAESFEDWAGDYGMDLEDGKAARTWRAVRAQTRDFINFLGGNDELEDLALNYERP